MRVHGSLLIAGVLVALAAPAAVAKPRSSSSCATIDVTTAHVGYAHVGTIQAAVREARPCDWILIAPGLYHGPVTVDTPDLHLRGLDRNGVVLEGGHAAANGIQVLAAGVSIENLTVRNFDRSSIDNEEDGNEIYWDGPDSGPPVRWWTGRYLTAYDTGLLGGYGLYAAHFVEGELDHVYASGFADSGLYIGSCRDCETIVQRSTAERNAVGFADTNAGGHLLIEDSTFDDNAVGLTLNSSKSDPPPPQLGTCSAAVGHPLLPQIASTRIARCTIVRDNRISDNNVLTVPSDTSSVRPGGGIGIDLLGAYADEIDDNTLSDNRNVGILALELPYGPPATAKPVHFQLAGNRFAHNRVSGSALGLALEGGFFGSKTSTNNCVTGNILAGSLPASLAPYSCANSTTPNPNRSASKRILGLVATLHQQLVSATRQAQPAPPPQQTMPDPCRGPPPSPLCRPH